MLREKIIEEQKMGISISNPTKNLENMMKMKPSPADLAKYGFDGVLIDLVKADPVILQFLCENQDFHRTVFYLIYHILHFIAILC